MIINYLSNDKSASRYELLVAVRKTFIPTCEVTR